LLILASTWGITAYQYSSQQLSLAATRATRQANAATQQANTATQQANATATSIAQFLATVHTSANQQTATAIAPTAVANPYPTYLPGKGLLIYVDPLQANTLWGTHADNGTGYSCGVENNNYHVHETLPTMFAYCGSSDTYSDFAFEVHMTIRQGDCGGVEFRSSNDGYYLFEVCTDSTYTLERYSKNSYDVTLAMGTIPSNFNIKGVLNVTNVLDVLAQGNTITLYINGQQLTQAHDSRFTDGYVGLVASENNQPTNVEYSDAKIWALT